MARFILIEPSHGGNVGAAARAIKTMGFDELYLVAPRDPKVLNRVETIQRASGATDVLKNAQIVATLDAALHDVNHLCATAMTARDFGPATYAPRVYFDLLQSEREAAQDLSDSPDPVDPVRDLRLAFLFGTERFGMRNEDVYRCHAALSIPANPLYGSLNLACAVQLIAYEWRLALGGFAVAAPRPTQRADAASIAAALAHWTQALTHLRFLDPAAPKKLMPRLNAVLNRAALREEELHILRGVAKAILETKPNHP